MSSKFFTWTKGDRRNASEAMRSNGIVPMAANSISINGMEYARTLKGSSKAAKRPDPLHFDSSPEPISKHSRCATETIALHDAAVQSATSLMAVVNDLLRSPPLSAHLTPQQHPRALLPMYGRQRSRTAPSAPLVEAPTVQPAELPGSLPVEKNAHFSLHHSGDGKVNPAFPRSAEPIVDSTLRPQSSPKEATHHIPDHAGVSTPVLLYTSTLRPPDQISPHPASVSPHLGIGAVPPGVPRDMDDTSVVRNRPLLTLTTQQGTSPDESLKSCSLPVSLQVSRTGTSNATPRICTFKDGYSASQEIHQTDSEAILVEQISSLRACHEDYLNTLKVSHEKEIASLRSYITFLEGRQGMQPVQSSHAKQSLTLDTSHSSLRPGEFHNSEVSTTTMQSFESLLEDQKSASQEILTDAETLTCKLSPHRKADPDAIELRKERDQLREVLDKSGRRISQLKDVVRKAKEKEKALKNAGLDLQARLVDANNERTDVLERYREACAKIRLLADSGTALRRELETLRQVTTSEPLHPPTTDTRQPMKDFVGVRSKHSRAVSDVGDTVEKGNITFQQVLELREIVTNKDAHIRRLEEVLKAETKAGPNPEALKPSSQSSRIPGLERSLEQHKHLLAAAQADSERYNSLLHSELRRQSRHAAEKMHSAAPKIEAEALNLATEELVRLKARSATMTQSRSAGMIATDTQSERLVAVLEKELEHCIKEIITHKLELKTCRKDLRKASAKGESLEVMSLPLPLTPDGESGASARKDSSPQMSRTQIAQSPRYELNPSGPTEFGLGISLPLPAQPKTKTAAPVITTALLSSNRAPNSSNMSSPPSRPKTPSSIHKKLPPPPALQHKALPATPPPSTKKPQRNGTLRSLSESIISSYAKRTPPAQAYVTTLSTTDRNSAPLQNSCSPPLPLSKFATKQTTP